MSGFRTTLTSLLQKLRPLRAIVLALLTLSSLPFPSFAVDPVSKYYGAQTPELDPKLNAPAQVQGDAFKSELLLDGKSNLPADTLSAQAQAYLQKETQKYPNLSTRAISSDDTTLVHITHDHFVKIALLRNNQIVQPLRYFAADPKLLVIDFLQGSPYLYVKASARVPGHTTNLFIETAEDGKIQSYTVRLAITDSNKIREQVHINLIHDKTPPLRSSEPSEEAPGSLSSLPFSSATSTAGTTNSPNSQNSNPSFLASKSSPTKRVLTQTQLLELAHTMIEMADRYTEAKELEQKTGRIIYTENDIQSYPGSRNTFHDQFEDAYWEIHRTFYFPKYDTILLDLRLWVEGPRPSMWDYSQIRWQPNQSPVLFNTSLAKPIKLKTASKKTNQVWSFLQGYELDPTAEFQPVFPKPENRADSTVPFSTTPPLQAQPPIAGDPNPATPSPPAKTPTQVPAPAPKLHLPTSLPKPPSPTLEAQ